MSGAFQVKKRLKGKVYKLSDNYFKLVVNLGFNADTGKYERKVKRFHGTKREAELYLREWIEALEADLAGERPKPVVSLADWLRKWCDDYARPNWEQNTYRRAKGIIENNIVPYAGHISIGDLLPVHLKDLYSYLSGDLSARTVRYVHTIIKQALKEALMLELIERNPAEKVTPPKDKSRSEKNWVVLSAEDLKGFLAGCQGHRDFALIYTAAYTGARQSELLGLTWDNILWDEPAIKICTTLHRAGKGEYEHRGQTKSRTSERIIDISPDVAEVLKEHRKIVLERHLRAGIRTDLVFTEPDGSPMNAGNLAHRFSNLARKLGYPGMTFHHLRHTHATILLSSGVYVNAVSERLGHADPSITLSIYGHVLPKDRKTLAHKFQAIMNNITERE